MDKKSAGLLKKMCSILEIVRWSCLISEVLLIGLFLIFVSDKGIYNTIFGSIRIDYLQLIFKNDLALNKDKMSGWLPLLFLGIAFLVFIIYKSVKAVEEICSLTIDHSPFDKRVSNYITKLAQYIVAGGIVRQPMARKGGVAQGIQSAYPLLDDLVRVLYGARFPAERSFRRLDDCDQPVRFYPFAAGIRGADYFTAT